MLGQSFTRHPHNRRRGGIDFDTADVPTLTLDVAERLDTHVSNLACRSIDTSPEFSVENNSTANPGAERQANNRATTPRCAAPHLAERRGVGVIFKQHAMTQLVFQSRAELESKQARNVWRINDHAGLRMNRSGHND